MVIVSAASDTAVRTLMSGSLEATCRPQRGVVQPNVLGLFTDGARFSLRQCQTDFSG
jgi:hypothetical protein